jgi:superoxide dismutase, Fe-Mn family
MTMPKYTLPDLPYDYDALEPHISSEVMELHHGKHHKAYVAGANEALTQLEAARSSGDFSFIMQLERNLAFHVSGHVLHSLLWESMGPEGGGAPTGALATQIDRDFGSLENLKAQLSAVTTTLQGSGWGALTWEPLAGHLVVHQLYDHQANVAIGAAPLLVVDGWEHAYYLDHQNDKAAWLEAFWHVVSWDHAEARFEALAAADLQTA